MFLSGWLGCEKVQRLRYVTYHAVMPWGFVHLCLTSCGDEWSTKHTHFTVSSTHHRKDITSGYLWGTGMVEQKESAEMVSKQMGGISATIPEVIFFCGGW